MRVVIIDDSLVHVRRLTSTLEALGHQVVGYAHTGAAGAQKFKEHRPDLVFLDVVMPEMDGLSALRLIRSIDENARVLMLTSMAGVGAQVDAALKLGAAGVIAKPATAEQIRDAIARITGKGNG